MGTRGGGVASEKLTASSWRTPDRSTRRIFAVPWPSTVFSSRGRMRGWKSTDSTEQPHSRSASKAIAGEWRIGAVYPAGQHRAAERRDALPAVVLGRHVLGDEGEL